MDRTHTIYALMMGTALACIVLAWFVIGGGIVSVLLSIVAAALVPLAAIVANAGREP